MSRTVKISSKYQVVIPKEIREAIKLQPGDQLLVGLENGKVVMRLKPKSYARYLRGLHKEVWQGVDATDYVKRERESWDS